MPIAVFAILFALQAGTAPRADNGADPTRTRADTVVVDPALLADAYLDPGARELVRRARERRAAVDQSIRAYRALARERISVGIRALRRERLLYRSETAARIHWRRFGASEIEVLGAREAIPIALPGVRVPEHIHGSLPHLAIDPAGERVVIGFGSNDGDDKSRRAFAPLATGSEADYRFASGDTTTIRLPDGREVRLVELKLIPRRRDFRLVSGSLWLETDSFAVVQAVFRLARAFDLERDADEDDVEDVPGILKPIRADIHFVTIDYGLWEMRWWLPRLVALEGIAQAGPLIRVPVRYERLYSEYEILGDTVALPPVTLALAGDSLGERCRGRGCICDGGRCRRVHVRLPDDTASLLTSELLPPSIFEEGDVLLSGDDVRNVTQILGSAIGAPAELGRPRLVWGFDRPGLVRYNRVEGLSIGARAEIELGDLAADLTARLGTADLEPGVEAGITRDGIERGYRLVAYRRLAPVDPTTRPFGFSNSLSALLFGRDDGDYYRALGVELAGRPAETRPAWYAWRIYAERQRPARVETRASLRRLLDRDADFRPNIEADRADQIGAALDLRIARGLDPVGFRWEAGLSLDGATGTFRYFRPAASLRLTAPLPGPLVGAIEGAAGTSFGEVPAQAEWFVGGPTTVRGYDPLTATGTAFWRGRAEVATSFPGARVALFTDAGWAGPREAFTADDALLASGVGVSLLDGLLRFDLARALHAPTGWKAHFYIDATL